MSALPEFKGFSTTALHAGQHADPVTGAVVPPISLSTTFAQESPGVLKAGYDYSRSGNPTRQNFEECVAALENGKYGFAFASGSATTTTIVSLLNAGDHVVSIDDVYGGTQRFFNKVASRLGITFTFADLTREGALQAAVTPATKMVWVESPTNPLLKITDIRAVAQFCQAQNLILVVDNTFCSPFLQRPLDLGASIVVHSVTKYLNGHSDVVMGVCVTSNDDLAARIKFLQNSIGAVPSPFDSYLALRGVKTLAIRMREHNKNAMACARMLEAHPKVESVIYPGLPSHPQHAVACQQMTGFGGMITFYLKGGITESRQFLENLKIFAVAESLGCVESLAEHPAIMTHASVPAERRAALGIADNLCRLSVGVEDVDDLIKDLQGALEHVKAA